MRNIIGYALAFLIAAQFAWAQPINPTDTTSTVTAVTGVTTAINTNAITPPLAGSDVLASLIVAPTVTASAYTTGYCVGGLQTIANFMRGTANPSGTITNVQVSDVSGQDASIDFVFLNANPTSSTITDHAACTINVADAAKVAGVVHVTDCSKLGASAPGTCQASASSGSTANGLPLPVTIATASTTAYVVAIVRGTPTYTATTNLQFRYNIRQN